MHPRLLLCTRNETSYVNKNDSILSGMHSYVPGSMPVSVSASVRVCTFLLLHLHCFICSKISNAHTWFTFSIDSGTHRTHMHNTTNHAQIKSKSKSISISMAKQQQLQTRRALLLSHTKFIRSNIWFVMLGVLLRYWLFVVTLISFPFFFFYSSPYKFAKRRHGTQRERLLIDASTLVVWKLIIFEWEITNCCKNMRKKWEKTSLNSEIKM